MADARSDDEREDDNGAQAFRRRRRGRNWALFGVLAALAVLFYAITIVRMGGG